MYVVFPVDGMNAETLSPGQPPCPPRTSFSRPRCKECGSSLRRTPSVAGPLGRCGKKAGKTQGKIFPGKNQEGRIRKDTVRTEGNQHADEVKRHRQNQEPEHTPDGFLGAFKMDLKHKCV